ncbi:MAG: DNA replication/repair protein RecF [Limisphaerales bacterium]
MGLDFNSTFGSATPGRFYSSPFPSFNLEALCRVHLSQLRLRDFRNYGRLDLEFTPGFQLFLGNNAQGKTNILEAIYLLSTLRSFRGVASAQMVRHGQAGFFVGGKTHHAGDHEIKLYWSAKERNLAVDGRPVRRMSEFLGVFRSVAFCSEDIQLVKGPASRRRRYLDLLLTQTHPQYLPLLQRYVRSVRSRNALLKQRVVDPGALEAFTQEMVATGEALMKMRLKLLPEIAPIAREAYSRITNAAEEFQLDYTPSVRNDFAVELRKNEARERVMRTTLVGPHRDELVLRLDDKSVAQFGSEGQKRSVVIALKMAQAEYLTNVHGSPPVLLIDDIMGELDVKRRSGFLPLLRRVHQAQSQVFMTCTEENWPAELGRNLQRWEVKAGKLSKA